MQKEYITKSSDKGMDMLVTKGQSSREVKVIKEGDSIKVDISLKSILLALGVIAAIYVAPKLFQIVVLLFFAFVVSSAALPLVRKLNEKGISKGLSIFIVYFAGVLIFFGALTLIFVPFVTQTKNLIDNLPTIVNDFSTKLEMVKIAGRTLNSETLTNWLQSGVDWLSKGFSFSGSEGIKSAIGALSSVAGGLLSVLTVLFLSIYMVADHDGFVDVVLLRIIDETKRKRVKQLFFDVEDKLGRWLIGQIILSFVIGLLNWILLSVARVPFALPLAVIAGLLESIPTFGPIISAIPAVLFATIAQGPVTGAIVLVGCAIIQQLENSFIVPRVMSNAVGLRPIVVIIAVTTGFSLLGPIGALLSVPIAVLLEIAYQFYLDLLKLKAKGIV